MMTEANWKRIEEYVEAGDPIKDCTDEGELYDYIIELRKKLKKLNKDYKELKFRWDSVSH